MAYYLLYFVHIIIDVLSSVATLNFIMDVLEKHVKEVSFTRASKESLKIIFINYDIQKFPFLFF